MSTLITFIWRNFEYYIINLTYQIATFSLKLNVNNGFLSVGDPMLIFSHHISMLTTFWIQITKSSKLLSFDLFLIFFITNILFLFKETGHNTTQEYFSVSSLHKLFNEFHLYFFITSFFHQIEKNEFFTTYDFLFTTTTQH